MSESSKTMDNIVHLQNVCTVHWLRLGQCTLRLSINSRCEHGRSHMGMGSLIRYHTVGRIALCSLCHHIYCTGTTNKMTYGFTFLSNHLHQRHDDLSFTRLLPSLISCWAILSYEFVIIVKYSPECRNYSLLSIHN
jgi:hypothetical protein